MRDRSTTPPACPQCPESYSADQMRENGARARVDDGAAVGAVLRQRCSDETKRQIRAVPRDLVGSGSSQALVISMERHAFNSRAKKKNGERADFEFGSRDLV